MTAMSDPGIERAVVGACATSPAALEFVTLEGDLAPSDFSEQRTRATFEACLRLADRGGYTAALVAGELEHDERLQGERHVLIVDAFVEQAAGGQELMAHVRRLHELAQRRRWHDASIAYAAAAVTGDEARVADAERILADQAGTEDTMSVERLAQDAFEYLSRAGHPGIATGLPNLDRQIGGGLRPGDMTAVGAWTGMGKSVLIDGMLTYAARHGANVHLYINEMSGTDRTLRLVASDGAAPYRDLALREVTPAAHQRVLDSLKHLPFAITDVSAWDGPRIARHIRTHRWDLCALDILHNVPHERTSELDSILRTLAAAARTSSSHVLLACHLNEERAKTDLLPFPVARDLRQSGMIKNICTNVLLLHREQERDGEQRVITTNDAAVYVDKARHGSLGGVALLFDAARMRFLALAPSDYRAVA